MRTDERIVANARRIAKKKGVKISEIERECGVSVGYLSRLMRPGTAYSMSVETLRKLAVALDTTMTELITEPVKVQLEYIFGFKTDAFGDVKSIAELNDALEVVNASIKDSGFSIEYSELRLIKNGHIKEVSDRYCVEENRDEA